MKNPLYCLQIAPDRQVRLDIETGKKKFAILEGVSDHKLGPCILACHAEPWAVMVNITSVHHCLAFEVKQQELEGDGFKDLPDMIEQMRQLCPAFDSKAVVTIIYWDSARGALADGAQGIDVQKQMEYLRLLGRGMDESDFTSLNNLLVQVKTQLPEWNKSAFRFDPSAAEEEHGRVMALVFKGAPMDVEAACKRWATANGEIKVSVITYGEQSLTAMAKSIIKQASLFLARKIWIRDLLVEQDEGREVDVMALIYSVS